VRTARGFHVWRRTDLPKTIKLADGEFRAGPTLTVAPHSVRGRVTYEWINPLPKGPLPLVEHPIFLGRNVAETAECHFSAISAVSAISATSSSSSAPLSIEDVINITQPQIGGERNLRILDLARGLKLNCGITGLAAVKDYVRRWHEKALPIIVTKDFDTTWADFIHAWERARHPLGMDLVDAAALHVYPDDLPEEAMRYESDTTRRLIGLCKAMAAMNGGRFFLSSHDAAGRLEVRPVQAWRLLTRRPPQPKCCWGQCWVAIYDGLGQLAGLRRIQARIIAPHQAHRHHLLPGVFTRQIAIENKSTKYLACRFVCSGVFDSYINL
jgi:hypothetical protein